MTEGGVFGEINLIWHGEEMRSMSVSACGYVQKNQRFTRSGNLYGEFSASSRSEDHGR